MTKKDKQLKWMVLSGMVNKFIKENSLDMLYILGLIGLFTFIPLIYIYANTANIDGFTLIKIVLAALYCGVTCKIYYSLGDKNIIKTVITFIVLISPFLFIHNVFKKTLFDAMSQMGIRNLSVSMFVDNKYVPLLDDVIHKNHLDGYKIQKIDNHYSRLDQVNVLFSGFGQVSLLNLANNRIQANFVLPTNAFYIQKTAVNRNVDELIQSIKSQCTDTFNQNKISFDYRHMVMRFDTSYGHFKVGEYSVSSSYRDVIVLTLQSLLDVLSQYGDLIDSIEIIGLSSEEWKGSHDDFDAYKYNYNLSVQRALAVSDIIFESKSLQKYSFWLSQRLVVRGGLSQGDINKKASRTVEIKIHLNQTGKGALFVPLQESLDL
jgi:hypothetical protein